MAALVTREDLGAWLIKCHPAVFDLAGLIDGGADTILRWSVRRGYRAELMSPGDRIIFWVSGRGEEFVRGIWGTGYLTDYVQDAAPEDPDADDPGYWLDAEARAAVELYIPCNIPLFESGVADRDLKAAGIDDLEVMRMPQGSNPSWVSTDQLKRLDPFLEWPEDVGGPGKQMTVTNNGAGFGDAKQNAVVEAAAMAAVLEFYGDDWEAEDVSPHKVGWDITFRHKTGPESYRVEVKGVSGSRPIVLLTANELRAAEAEPEWILAVVTRALSDPQVVEYTARDALTAAKPYVFRARMPDMR